MAKKTTYIKEKTNLFYLICIFFILLPIHFSSFKNTIDKSYESYITLKITGSGNKKVINKYQPDIIYIDEEIQTNIKNTYDLKPENIVKLVWNNNIRNCERMFYSCNEIIEINLTHFDSSLVTQMNCMFLDCTNLVSVDLSNLDTSNVKNFGQMFQNCFSLISLDVSHFNTGKAWNIGTMFCNCSSLKSLNVSNFDTSQIQYFDNVFNGCSNLTSINLSNFQTSKAIKMEKMFKNCVSLTYIDIHHFDATHITKINDMFNGCISLISLDFSKIDLSKVSNIDDMKNIFNNCNNLEYLNIKNYDPNKYLENNDFFPDTSKTIVVCSKNNALIDIIEDQKCNIIICENSFENTICSENCTMNNHQYFYKSNCYFRNSNRTYNNSYICLAFYNEEAPFRLIYTHECVNKCPIRYIIDKTYIFNYSNIKEEDKGNKIKKEIIEKACDVILKNIEKDFTSDCFNTSGFDNGKNYIIEFEEMMVTLTTVENQNKNKNSTNNITSIYLGECEAILREKYNITDDKVLYMKKIDVKQEGFKIPKIEFDIYTKLNDTNLVKLNLSYCRNSKAEIIIPIIIYKDENIDKYNSSSGYYNDLCYATTSDYGTDIISKDRQEDIITENRTVCQEKCTFSDYDYDIHKATCTCDIVESSSFFVNIKINKTELYRNFKDIKNIANIGLFSCYKELFSKKGLLHNYGNYSLIPLIIAHFIFIIVYYEKNLYNKIKEKIKDIKFGISNWHLIESKGKSSKNNDKKEKNDNKGKESNKMRTNNIQNTNEIKKKKEYNNKKARFIKLYPNSNPTKKNNIINNKNNNKDKKQRNKKVDNIIDSQTQNGKSIGNLKTSVKDDLILEKVKGIMSYNDEELNNLKFELAFKIDHRKYSQYYISLLKTKHIIFYTFFNDTDYNSKIIKIDLFLFNFTLYYAVNTFFFDDKTMYKIYIDRGSFNINYQLPLILYSLIISIVLNILSKKLALSQGLILDFKGDKKTEKLDTRKIKLEKKIKIKFLLYFIISSIFLLFFWFYISLFCAIYTNTQIHLIKDTLISFVLSLIYSFFINLIPGIFRIPSLSNPKKKRKYLYIISQIIQII